MAPSNLKPPKQRRVLGSPFKSPDSANNKQTNNLFPSLGSGTQASPTPLRQEGTNDTIKIDKSLEPENGSEEDADHSEISDEVVCPICSEGMISLYQLNQHIDDEHNETKLETKLETKSSSSETNDTPTKLAFDFPIPKIINNELNNDIRKWFKKDQPNEVTTPKRKTIKLDLLDNNKEFGLSDNSTTNVNEFHETLPSSTSPSSNMKSRISRSHWKKPLTSQNICSHPHCKRPLSVKNGIVNCRKCGELFCNQHTYNKVKLKNSEGGQQPEYDSTRSGQWGRCCERCYMSKPDLTLGTQANIHDVTNVFKAKRQLQIDTKELIRNKIQKKFIKLINLHANEYLSKKDKTLLSLGWLSLSNFKDSILESEKNIVGDDNWQDDSLITNCNVCLSQFTIFIRKHHCRLCGNIVCDDPFGERLNCSINVPLSKLLDKLTTLNYSPLVKLNMKELINLEDELFSARCCIRCKNDLLHNWKSNPEPDSQETEIVMIYDQILMVKGNIQAMVKKYQNLVNNPNHQETKKVRNKIMTFMKDFESLTLQFRNTFFEKIDNTLIIRPSHSKHAKLINNIYHGSAMFLQETLVCVKELNKEFQQQENKLLELIKPTEPPEKPKLSKREIRELRESLMVMNEQKFMVENLIDQVTKQRKFDELTPLIENKNELDKAIKGLESQLGNHGF